MSVLDKANEPVRAFPIVYVDDGYGGFNPSYDPDNFVEFDAFCIPVGFSGAGWAIDAKIEAQGWADVNRVRVIFAPVDGQAPTGKWGRIEFLTQSWTIQEVPRLVRGLRRRQDFISMTVELQGGL